MILNLNMFYYASCTHTIIPVQDKPIKINNIVKSINGATVSAWGGHCSISSSFFETDMFVVIFGTRAKAYTVQCG